MTQESFLKIHEMYRIMGWDPGPITAIEILSKLDQTGSINSAAKALGVSYKSAWQKLDQLNNIVPYQLIKKKTGGSGGGGSAVTQQGKQLIEHIRLLQKEFHQFMGFFSVNRDEALQTLNTLRRLEMKLSARNVWVGQVEFIEQGAVNSVVNITLKGGDKISSVITDNSVGRLELVPGKEVMAIVKATSVLLGREIPPEHISARNILTGHIAHIVQGDINNEITLDLPGGSTVTSIITSNSVERLKITQGEQVTALIKATDVFLARISHQFRRCQVR